MNDTVFDPTENSDQKPKSDEKPKDDEDVVVLHNVFSAFLGFVVKNGNVPKLLTKNTPLPCRSEVKTYTNTGKSLVLEVYQGESNYWQHCKLVGRYPVKIPENSKPKSLRFQLVIAVNENMCLEVIYKRIDSESGDEQVFRGTNVNEESEETVRLIQHNMEERDRNEQIKKNYDDLVNQVSEYLRKKTKLRESWKNTINATKNSSKCMMSFARNSISDLFIKHLNFTFVFKKQIDEYFN
ncbi:hypothetical protein TVAG_152510 [Trichomonas vaginalis G3]|uniref:Uncharacterized protein n=1 Tax=Trichomonas vaginalis (strain ATCC PRA-98 / G3) TaxID=412133 RepID=A2FPJ9_TRIV3|nr:heat shock protein 70kD (HSP70), peptide-binding domain family [Trichomonas vaginalis G3]EAX93163.1 hypothetical protein TVAG_152510 [Trichomonas vaginalis G3]KAI5509871.1 heat shock protein 70kD (HSP70), peptide-binding domain family [Trichomonas vaginalis G3]|eukprot:XP_001306093.1 hypothetical protein [Trichomonas vaginalis G3]